MTLPPNCSHFHTYSLPTLCTPRDRALLFLRSFLHTYYFQPRKDFTDSHITIHYLRVRNCLSKVLGKVGNRNEHCMFAKDRLYTAKLCKKIKKCKQSPYSLLLVSVRHRWCSLDDLMHTIPFHCALKQTKLPPPRWAELGDGDQQEGGCQSRGIHLHTIIKLATQLVQRSKELT